MTNVVVVPSAGEPAWEGDLTEHILEQVISGLEKPSQALSKRLAMELRRARREGLSDEWLRTLSLMARDLLAARTAVAGLKADLQTVIEHHRRDVERDTQTIADLREQLEAAR